jgi:hypothetical protein
MILANKIALLRDAIKNHKQVTGLCKTYPREFCPHLLGIGNRGWAVLVWQYGGLSESGLPLEGDWRCFDLDDMEQLASREGQWHRGFHSGRGKSHCVKKMDTVVDSTHSAEIRESYGGLIRRRGFPPPLRRDWL